MFGCYCCTMYVTCSLPSVYVCDRSEVSCLLKQNVAVATCDLLPTSMYQVAAVWRGHISLPHGAPPWRTGPPVQACAGPDSRREPEGGDMSAPALLSLFVSCTVYFCTSTEIASNSWRLYLTAHLPCSVQCSHTSIYSDIVLNLHRSFLCAMEGGTVIIFLKQMYGNRSS